MDPDAIGHYKQLMQRYSQVVFRVSSDLQFWSTFLPAAIEAHRQIYPDPAFYFESGLFVYNISLNGEPGWLYPLQPSFTIDEDNIAASRVAFFQWIQVISLVRVYNSLETLVYSAIEKKYFPNPTGKKMATKALKTKILTEIKAAGLKDEINNNQFLLTFLKHRSPAASHFLGLPVRDLPYTWESFFIFLSIIRHLIVHESMLVSKENFNTLNSRYPLFLAQYFRLEPTEGGEKQLVIDETRSGLANLISLCDDFAFNLVKFILEVERIDV